MKRRKHTPQTKVAILKAHLVDGKPVSELCDQHGLSPTLFYRWQKEFFENGSVAFEKDHRSIQGRLEREIAEFKSKLARKDNVIAELMEEYVLLKKKLGAV